MPTPRFQDDSTGGQEAMMTTPPTARKTLSTMKRLVLIFDRACTSIKTNQGPTAIGPLVQTVFQRCRTIEKAFESVLAEMLWHVVDDEKANLLASDPDQPYWDIAESLLTAELKDKEVYQERLGDMDRCLEALDGLANRLLDSNLDGQRMGEQIDKAAPLLSGGIEALSMLKFKNSVTGQGSSDRPPDMVPGMRKILAKAKKFRHHVSKLCHLITDAWACDCVGPHVADLLLQSLEALEGDRFNIVLHSGAMGENERPWISRVIKVVAQELDFDEQSPQATTVRFVLDSASKKNKSKAQDIARGTPASETNSTIQDLCSTLRKETVIGSTLGVLNDENYTYSLALKTANDLIGEKVESLEEILEGSSTSSRLRRLSDRYRLALTIASAHLHLHPTSWLGSHWNHESIVFPISKGSPLVERPFLRSLSSHKRPASAAFGQDIATQTLGIILLELYTGTTLSRHLLRAPNSSTVAEDIENAIEWYKTIQSEADVEFDETFKTIVYWCLFPQQRDLDQDGWRHEMHQKVVAPLEDMVKSTAAIRTANFDRSAKKLRDCIDQEMISYDTDERNSGISGTEFCPYYGLQDIVRLNRTLIKTLYIESVKAQPLSDGSFPQMLAKDRLRIQGEAQQFYDGLNLQEFFRCVFGTFLLTKTTPTSSAWFAAWTVFTEACRTIASPGKHQQAEIDNWSLANCAFPLDEKSLRELFRSENRSEIASFRSLQYCFCAVKLSEGEQVKEGVQEHNWNLRLPLKSRRSISSGSQGSVYRVRVTAGYLFDSDRQLAMKETLALDSRQDEWRKTKSLRDQITTHHCIMKAHASVKLGMKVFIFYDLAQCDLIDYMCQQNPEGPVTLREKQGAFQMIYEIADALEHLHCNLRAHPYRTVCFHKDLKAENILVCERQNPHDAPGLIFKITDFGIASDATEDPPSNERSSGASSKKERSSVRNQGVRTALGDDLPHSAPEARNEGLVSASADVWAFGTVFAEYLAWMYGGASSMNKFEEARKGKHDNSMFYEIRTVKPGIKDNDSKTIQSNHSTAYLRREVSAWYESKVKKIPTNSGRGLISNGWKMLHEQLLVCDPSKRARIEVVCKRMNRIARDLDQKDGYGGKFTG